MKKFGIELIDTKFSYILGKDVYHKHLVVGFSAMFK